MRCEGQGSAGAQLEHRGAHGLREHPTLARRSRAGVLLGWIRLQAMVDAKNSLLLLGRQAAVLIFLVRGLVKPVTAARDLNDIGMVKQAI